MSWHAVPNVIVDELMAKVSPAAYKVHAVIVRQTIGWHRTEDTISISQFIQMTGLSKNSVIRALRELVECDAVIRREQTVNGVSVYTYRITHGSAEIEQGSSNLGSAKSELGSSEIEPPSAKIEPVGSSNFEQGVVPNLNTQKKDINKRETKKKETKKSATAVALEVPDDSPKVKLSETRDDRLDDSRIMAYRDIARLTPPYATRDRIITEVRSDDIATWQKAIRDWIASGWNPRNIAGMIDQYKRITKPAEEEQTDGEERLSPEILEHRRKVAEYLEANKKWITDWERPTTVAKPPRQNRGY